MHRSEGRRWPQPRSRGAYVKDVGFILSDFLNLFAGVIGLNDERPFSCLRGLECERKTCLTRELLQESFAGAFQPWLGVTRERYRKRRFHCEAARAGLHVGGKRHKIQCRLLSCGHCRVQQNAKHGYAETSYPRFLSHCPENPPP